MWREPIIGRAPVLAREPYLLRLPEAVREPYLARVPRELREPPRVRAPYARREPTQGPGMTDRLPGRCDCGHPTYDLGGSEYCPCHDCHPGGRLWRASGASGPAGPALRRAPAVRPRKRERPGRLRRAKEAGAGLEDRPQTRR